MEYNQRPSTSDLLVLNRVKLSIREQDITNAVAELKIREEDLKMRSAALDEREKQLAKRELDLEKKMAGLLMFTLTKELK